MSGVLKTNIWTGELSTDTIIITESMGAKGVSIFCSTATSGTVTGGVSLGALPSSAITITEDLSYNVEAIEASVLGELTIVSPAGCVLKITALI